MLWLTRLMPWAPRTGERIPFSLFAILLTVLRAELCGSVQLYILRAARVRLDLSMRDREVPCTSAYRFDLDAMCRVP